MNIAVIIIAVLAIAAIVYGCLKQIPAAKAVALKWVIEAERLYGSGTGMIKYEVVAGAIHEWMPLWMRLFVTKKFISDLIEEAVTYMKEELGEVEIQTSGGVY